MYYHNYSYMFKKILFNFLLIFILCFSGCEEFYSFEAKKLNKKAQELIEESKIISDIDEKIILLSNALKKVKKIQKKYPKTKVARLHRKEKKIDNLNLNIDELKKISEKQSIERKKSANLDKIKKNIDLANVEFKNGDKLKSSLNLLNAAELSIDQIGDTRTKSRLSNEISKLRIFLNDKEKAFQNLLMSEKYIDEMYTDLPKKIKNLTKVYKMFHELDKEDKKKEIEKKIYLIINNEISNNDNKAVAFTEIAKTNLLIENTYKVKEDLKKASKLSEKSNTYLDIAKILYKINDIKELNVILKKAKNAAKSKNQEFWIIRELINISLFEDSINKKEESYKTLLDAKNNIPKIPDERLVLELVDAFAKINKIKESEKLIKLIKPKYEQSMAYAFIGKQLGIKGNLTEMKSFSDKALKIAPDLIVGNYEFQGLPGFSTKGRIFAEVAKSYALIGDFNVAYKLLGIIESDRFYKEGVSEILIIQAKSDKIGARNLALKMLELGGKIIDNKFLGQVAYAQAITGDIENSLLTTKKMDIGFDFSQVLINIAKQISLQQASPLT